VGHAPPSSQSLSVVGSAMAVGGIVCLDQPEEQELPLFAKLGFFVIPQFQSGFHGQWHAQSPPPLYCGIDPSVYIPN